MVKRPLIHSDFITGKRYKVIKRPSHLIGVQYPYLDKTGICRWISLVHHSVQILFDNCIERLVPFECLEAVEEEKSKIEKPKMLTEQTVKIGSLYKVFKTPHFYETAGYDCPALDKVGKLVKTYKDSGALLVFDNNTQQHFIPYDYLIEVFENQITDDMLIKKMLDNPEGVLKIVKGLAKMNKDSRLLSFVERGNL